MSAPEANVDASLEAPPKAALVGARSARFRKGSVLLGVFAVIAALAILAVAGILYGVARGSKDARVTPNSDLVSTSSGAPVRVLATAKSITTAGFTASADDATFYRKLTSATLRYETGATITFATSGFTRVDNSTVFLHTLLSSFPFVAVDGAAAYSVAAADAGAILQAVGAVSTQRALVAALPARRLQAVTISGTTPACGMGAYESTPTSCSQCSANSYSNTSGATSCTSCAAGYGTCFYPPTAGLCLTGQSSCFEVRMWQEVALCTLRLAFTLPPHHHPPKSTVPR